MPPKLRVPRPIEVVLVLSVALNLFVAGGFAYSQYSAAHQSQPAAAGPEKRLEVFAQKLGLDPEHSPTFKDWRKSLRTAQAALLKENQPLLAEAWDDLRMPAPDQARIQQVLDQMAANRRAFQAEATTATIKFLNTLSESQKRTFMNMVVDRNNPYAAPVRNSLGN